MKIKDKIKKSGCRKRRDRHSRIETQEKGLPTAKVTLSNRSTIDVLNLRDYTLVQPKGSPVPFYRRNTLIKN